MQSPARGTRIKSTAVHRSVAGGGTHKAREQERRRARATRKLAIRLEALEYSILEQRALLNAVPFGIPDPHFVTPMNAQLVVNATNGVLANDFDAEGATLTATSFTSPANGTLTANSNGSFTYTPNNNFVGFDHFTYTAFDGTHHSTPTKVSISVGQVFSERLQGDERGPNNLLHTGALAVTVPF
jgi:VCBS repeat-containing protein